MDNFDQLKQTVKITEADRRGIALKRLGLESAPLSFGLEELFRTVWPGGFQQIVTEILPYMTEGRSDYTALIALYETVSPTDKPRLFPEDYLAAVGILPGEFLGDITKAAFNKNATIAAMMVAIAQPKIIAATIDAATGKKNSVADRNMLLKITKTLPIPKGQEINVNFGPKGVPEGEGADTPLEGAKSYIKFEQSIRENVDDLRIGEGRKLIESATKVEHDNNDWVDAEVINETKE